MSQVLGAVRSRCGFSVVLVVLVSMLGSTFAAMMFDHPPPPVDVVASESPSGVQISWTEIPEEFFATGYNIYRSMVSTMADPAVKVNEQPLQGSSFLDSTVF